MNRLTLSEQFFRDQALTVTISLMVSIATALILQPMVSARILRKGAEHPRGLFKLSDAMFSGLFKSVSAVDI